MKTQQPQVDPALLMEQQRAEQERVLVVQDQLGSETERVFRMFGARTAVSGGSISAPRLASFSTCSH